MPTEVVSAEDVVAFWRAAGKDREEGIPLAAKALFRQAESYRRLGDPKAAELYTTLVSTGLPLPSSWLFPRQIVFSSERTEFPSLTSSECTVTNVQASMSQRIHRGCLLTRSQGLC